MSTEDKTYRTQQGEIRYWIAHQGHDAPWLVFLPGLTADHTLFDAQMAHFKGKANCLTWDAPAHGLSRPYPLGFSLDDCAEALHGILEAEGAARPVLVGQSFGGYVAQAYLALYPGEASGFVSIDSSPLQRRLYEGWELWTLKHAEGMFRCIPWNALVKWSADGNALTQAGRGNMREMMLAYGKREYCALVGHSYRIAADAILADRPYAADCPVLLLCGEKDATGYVKRYCREWSRSLGAPLVWVPDAAHNSNVDNPEFVNAQIERFAGRIGL
ncbi:MAG: alpha/beta hydrolase [Eggerthellaceae bacterium]|nr:alpha/beta hydrolase [Eggerthellaceae bacterium]